MTTPRALRFAVGSGLFLIALASTAVQAQPNPKAILEKASAVMKNAKTYQATVLMNGPTGTMTSDIKLVMGKKMAATMTQGGQTQMQMKDDGTAAYVYFPAMKQYTKGPSQAAKTTTTGSFTDFVPKNGTYKMLPSTNIGGKPAYAIEITLPNMQPNPANKQANQKMIVYIDQATNRFKQMVMNAGPQGPMKVTIANEKVNEPIPDGVFKFTPPAGAKLMQGGMMGRPPMMGGAPSRH